MPCVRRNPTAGFQLQGARVLPIMHGTTDEWRERSPWGAQSLALGHHGRKSDRARAAAFNRALAQGQASRRQWVLTFPFSWRPRLAQEREACPWGTVNCSVGLHRSSWIARSLALGHGTCVLCTSSGAGGRPGCEDRRGHRGTEDILRSALKPNAVKLRPPASEEPPGWFMVQRCFRARFRSARLVASSTHRSTSRLIRA